MENSAELDELLDYIKEYVYLTSLDNDMIKMINDFMARYLKALDEHLNSETVNAENEKNYAKMADFVDFVYRNFPDGKETDEPYPAVEIIKKANDKYWEDVEKIFGSYEISEEKAKNPNKVSYAKINGFASAIVIVAITCIVGFLLGAALFFLY